MEDIDVDRELIAATTSKKSSRNKDVNGVNG